MNKEPRCFRVKTKKCACEFNAIIKTCSAAKAKYAYWSSANECGYHVKFGDLTVCRAPEFDKLNIDLRRPYSEGYVREAMNE